MVLSNESDFLTRSRMLKEEGGLGYQGRRNGVGEYMQFERLRESISETRDATCLEHLSEV